MIGRWRIVRATLGLVVVALLLCLVAGCGNRGDVVERRFLLVGLDGLEWSAVEPLLEEGRLPNLQALMNRGVWCRLRSLEPKRKSPVIWTTMATGKLPEKHGISDYVDPTTKKLLTSNVRTARTFWDILGERGLTVTVIGWLVSWPAEEVNGYMVTDYFRYPPKPDRPLPENLTYPDELVAEIEPLRVVDRNIPDSEVERFFDIANAMSGEEAQRLPVDEMFREMRAISDMEGHMEQFKDFFAADRTYMAVAQHLIRKHPTDISVVYLRGTDSVSHKFWAAGWPGDVGVEVAETDTRVFGETVERYYVYADEMLGELIAEFGDDATVMVCSDHGFTGPRSPNERGGIKDHGPLGVFVLAGPGIRSGGEIEETSVRDITPTILELFGLPIGEDMDGVVMVEAFEDDYLSAHPVRQIPTYEISEEEE
ncbi:alkaline phosphatase family protein [bacterium]|nr:alkaline phosphatase family protein [bacterium]